MAGEVAPGASATLLSIRGLGVRFGSFQALGPLDIDVNDGEFLTVLGPSGSGKTTLLRAIAGFTKPGDGKIEFDGRDIAGVPINERPFNTVFQDYALFPHMTVRQNVGFGLKVRGTKKGVVKEKVDAVLQTVGLERLGDRYPAQVSGGQQQRTALARAMICEPRLILLDEPLAALDASLRRQMQGFLKSVQRRSGITFVFVTHDQSEAITMSDRICVMREGSMVQVGTPRDLYYRPNSRFVASFFGASNIVEPCSVKQAGEGETQVSTPEGDFTVAGSIAKGNSNLALAIRPEALVPAQAGGVNTMEAEVVSVNFVGSETITEIRHRKTRKAFTMKATSDPAARPAEIGSALAVSFDPTECAVVAGD